MAGFTYHTWFSQGSRISKNIYLSMITYYHPFLFQLLNNKFEICCKCSQAVDWLIWRIQSAVFCTALQKLFWKMSPDKDLIEKSPIGCLWGSIQMLKENSSRDKVDNFLSEFNSGKKILATTLSGVLPLCTLGRDQYESSTNSPLF